jgi:uncharacterized small protein (DUF1192 family)
MDSDEQPKPKPNMVIGESLDLASLSELKQRVHALESEITRVKDEMTRKQASAATANAYFKT